MACPGKAVTAEGPDRAVPAGSALRYTARKKHRFSRRVKDIVGAGVAFGLIGLFRCFDVDRASAIGGWLGRHVFARPFSGQRTVDSIRVAFPDIDEARLRTILTGMAANLGRVGAETAHLADFMGDEGRRRFTFEGLEHLEAARARGKPLMIVSGHFGNFELVFIALHHVGIRCAGITRRPSNRYIADWAANNRARLGFDLQFTNEHDGTRLMFSRLRSGGDVAMLVDLAVKAGIPVPLFGRPAMTALTPAKFAQELGVTILPMAIRRDEGVHFTAVFHPPILPAHSGNDARDIFDMTRAMNAFVEEEILARPNEWLWMYPRWKPVAELSRRAQRLLQQAGESGAAGS